MDVELEIHREEGTVEVAWSGLGVDRAEVARYRPSVVIAGHPIDWSPRTEARLTFPWSIVSASVASELGLRVVVELVDGREVGPFDAPWTLPPFHDVEPASEWVVGPAVLLADDGSRRALGLDTWVDGCIGFAAFDGQPVGFGANGGDGRDPAGVASWTVGEGGAVGEVRSRRTPITGVDADYAAGGPVWRPDRGDDLFMLYHGEVHPGGDPADFWSFVGLATSSDRGATWVDLGRIIEPELAVDAPRAIFTEVCGAPYAIRTDGGVAHMYVYFRDTLADGSMLNMSVARAPLTGVVRAGATGTAPEFRKWHEGGWTSPGRGGPSTDLMPGAPTPRWFDVVEHVDHGDLVMVLSDGFTSTWTYLLTTSRDGLSWSAPRRLGHPDEGVEQLYLTLSSPDRASQRVVEGSTIDLFRVRSTSSGASRWDAAVLERLPLTRQG